MNRLAYVSVANPDNETSDLLNILQVAQRNNAAHDITGLLLFNGFNFLQVLEGPAIAVRQVYFQIIADRRHHAVSIILDEQVRTRDFPDWSMKLSVFMSGRDPSIPGLPATTDLRADLPPQISAQIARVIDNFATLKS